MRGEAEFLVREDFADEAPRAGRGRRPQPVHGAVPGRPALAVASRTRSAPSGGAVARQRCSELGLAGYLDTARRRRLVLAARARGFAAVELERQSAAGVRRRAGRPRGAPSSAWPQSAGRCRRASFVFVCSDFLGLADPARWLRALGFRWDLVPVVVQDPVWEQSFPPVDGLVVPFADPATRTACRQVRLSAREAERGARRTRARLERAARGVPQPRARPVLVGDAAPDAVLTRFTTWAEARLANRRGEWR